jgi:hypothetical protein
MSEEEIFIAGVVRLNGKHAPFIEILIDTASGRGDGELVLLKQISGGHYCDKIKDTTMPTTILVPTEVPMESRPIKRSLSNKIHFSERAWDIAKRLGVEEEITEKISLCGNSLKFSEGKDTIWVFDLRKHPKTKKLTIYVQRRSKKNE